MIDEPEFQRLREISWQRPLTPLEASQVQSWLDRHPEAAAEWNQDSKLSDQLKTLPDTPVSSNFTHRVLQAVDAYHAQRQRAAWEARRGWGRWRRWLPQIATATVVAVFALGGYRILQEQARQKELSMGVRLAQTMAAVPHAEALQDFHFIQELSAVPHPVDFELLEALESQPEAR